MKDRYQRRTWEVDDAKEWADVCIGMFVFALAAWSPPSFAGLIDLPNSENKVLIDESDPIYAMLVGNIDYGSGLGSFYLSCRRGYTSHYKFNIIIKTHIYNPLVEADLKDAKLFVGVRNAKSRARSDHFTLADGTKVPGLSAIVEPLIRITQDYSPVWISDKATIYLASSVDATFLQAFLDGEHVVIGQKTRDGISFSPTKYTLVPQFVSRFMAACSSR